MRAGEGCIKWPHVLLPKGGVYEHSHWRCHAIGASEQKVEPWSKRRRAPEREQAGGSHHSILLRNRLSTGAEPLRS